MVLEALLAATAGDVTWPPGSQRDRERAGGLGTVVIGKRSTFLLPKRCPPNAQRLWLDCKQQSWPSGDIGMDRFWRRWTNECHGPKVQGIPEARARRCIGPGVSHGAESQWGRRLVSETSDKSGQQVVGMLLVGVGLRLPALGSAGWGGRAGLRKTPRPGQAGFRLDWALLGRGAGWAGREVSWLGASATSAWRLVSLSLGPKTCFGASFSSHLWQQWAHTNHENSTARRTGSWASRQKF